MSSILHEQDLRISRDVAPVRTQAVAAIKAQIANGRFSPGERLVERELCELLGISRTTVREALRQLEAKGLIVVPPRSGPTVAVISESEARAIYEVREALECAAIGLFVERATDAEITTLERTVQTLAGAYHAGDIDRALAVKDEFYEVLYHGARNDILRTQVATLHDRVARLRIQSLSAPGRALQSVAEVRELVAAISSRDAATATDRWRTHLRNACAAALAGASRGDEGAGRAAQRTA